METKELIEKLNKEQITQMSIDFFEDGTIYKDLSGFTLVTDNLNIDTHRWYELSTTVIKRGEDFIGIRHISNIFSEEMDCDDVCHHLEFFEMKPVQTITYVKV